MLLNFIIAIQLEERVSVTVTAVWKSGSDMTFNNQGEQADTVWSHQPIVLPWIIETNGGMNKI